MREITTCEDCQFNITIYRFTGQQGFFRVPKKWCEECDLLVRMVKNTIKDLELATFFNKFGMACSNINN